MLPFWLFAIISPILFGLMNVIDKSVIAHKVKHSLSYAVIAASVNGLLGLIIGSFLSWEGVVLQHLLFPVFAGILIGIQFFFYYLVLENEDITHVIGLMYTFPLLVALFSFVFLHERIPLFGYVGMFFVVAGALTIYKRIKLHNTSSSRYSLFLIAILIVLIACNELSLKIATDSLSPLQGLSVTMISVGIVVCSSLVFSSVRRGIYSELRNIHWALAAESLNLTAYGCLYAAMSGLPATIVSSIGAVQLVAVLGFERIADTYSGKIVKDHLILPKLKSILLITVGLVLLYAAGA